jgi:hypothetical protein
VKNHKAVNYIHVNRLHATFVYKICTSDCVDICVSADSLIVTQYMWYSREFNGDNMCGTADSLMVTQLVRPSRQFNGDTICEVQKTV